MLNFSFLLDWTFWLLVNDWVNYNDYDDDNNEDVNDVDAGEEADLEQAGQETHTGPQLFFTLDRFYGDPHHHRPCHNLLAIPATS